MIKSLGSACEVLRKEQKDVSAETFFGVKSEVELQADCPFAAQRADALVLMAEAFQVGDRVIRSGGERCLVVVHVDEQVLKQPHASGRCECESGPILAAQTARRLACDASLVRVVNDEHGEPLSVGRRTRSIPTALRRALQLRDRHFLDAHHILHWADGGGTDVENLALLCRHHHRLLHEEGFQVRRENTGNLTFISPRGSRIHDVPQSVTSDISLETFNQQNGFDINPNTAMPNWHGELMDLDLAVGRLFALTHSAGE